MSLLGSQIITSGYENGCRDGWTNHECVENSSDKELICNQAYIKNIMVDNYGFQQSFI